ncbi:unnamed protein product [Owenia fusiformis]|uniref:Uncharacterized protein n=1 Tax=Owenia fusiformis TaxID=6347 RepID=A0A8J1T5R9_OWEFU|nr:unnamed protein product [Owenia fusiformis]
MSQISTTNRIQRVDNFVRKKGSLKSGSYPGPFSLIMADDLTESELRRELTAFGVSGIGPITATTRALWERKLNNLRASSKKSDRSSRTALSARKAVGFSSDESDQEFSPSSQSRRQVNNKRKSISTSKSNKLGNDKSPLIIPPIAGRQPLRSRHRGRQTKEEKTVSDFPVKTKPSTFSTVTATRKDEDEFSSSDSDIENVSTAAAATNTSSSLETSYRMDATLDERSTPDSFTSSRFRSNVGKRSTPSTSKMFVQNNQHNGPPYGFNTMNRANDNNIKVQRTANTSAYKDILSNSISINPKPISPFGNHVKPNEELMSEDTIIKKGFKTKDDPESYRRSQYISKAVVILGILFFVCVSGIYIAMKATLPYEGSENDNVPICGENGLTYGKNTDFCIQPEDVESVLYWTNELYLELSIIAGNKQCGYSHKSAMTKPEFQAFLKKQGLKEDEEKMSQYLLELLKKNPHWNMRVETKGSDLVELESMVPYMSIFCRIHKAFSKVLYWILAALAIVLFTWLGVLYMRYRWRRQENELREVYSMIDRIMDVLKQHHDASQANKELGLEPTLAILHVRDMLISHKERRHMQPIWDKAVAFLAENESRVRVETQMISGEEYEVWRWLQAYTNGSKNYKWQGPAFGSNSESGANPLSYNLTPCLKIRNMFDASIEYEDNWHIRIQDAILDKCEQNKCDIVHIAVDKTSKEGCVYLKCRTAESAGNAYKLLHGWWFDGNLVTVKYLREERYHERFPDAKSSAANLNPSNNKKLSMQQPYFKSALEMS